MTRRQFIVLAILAVLAVEARAADWPQWLGPKRDNSSSETVAAWKEAPNALWRKPTGPGFAAPVIADGRVFVHARVKGKEAEEVIAFDAKTGDELWRDVYDRAPYASVLNTGPQATPTVAGKRVFTYGITGVLSCYETATGKRLWQIDAYKKLKIGLPRFGVCCSPLVVGNRVVISVGGKGSSIVGLDADNGEIAWQTFDEPAGTTSPVLFPRQGSLPDAVFMTTLRIAGLNPIDGSLTWEHPLIFRPSGTAPTPLVIGEMLLVSTMDNGTTAVRVRGEDKPSVERLWQNADMAGYFSTGAASSDRIFLVTNVLKPVPSTSLCCVDSKSGKEIWAKSGLGFFHCGLLRTGDGKLLILTDGGSLRLVEGSSKEYRELSATKVCGGTFCNPALSGGRVYVRDDKEIICLQMAK